MVKNNDIVSGRQKRIAVYLHQQDQLFYYRPDLVLLPEWEDLHTSVKEKYLRIADQILDIIDEQAKVKEWEGV